jgi:yecA family protein
MARTARRVEAPTLLPPKLSEFGHEAFSANELETLARWLQESTWPRGSLNIYSLEGYLTALLVWPVAVQPGAWLPPIWSETSWRVRPPIDNEQAYAKFLEFVVGFLRWIDRGLLQAPAQFEPGVHLAFGHQDLTLNGRLQYWAQGFGLGVRRGSLTRVTSSAEDRDAVRMIAALTTAPLCSSNADMHRVETNLTRAILALARTRASRGPLGPLPTKATTSAPTVPKIQSPQSTDPLDDGSHE